MSSPLCRSLGRLLVVATLVTGLPTALSVPGADAGSILDGLRRAPEGTRSGYDRSLFIHWVDADGNGCDTRHEVLIAESVVPAEVGAGCSVSGRWTSAYDGVTRTDASTLDVDHMVPLAEAWESGATIWDRDRRRQFANDLDLAASLAAVSAASNRSKGDGDPAEWLPPRQEAWCSYVGDWVAVKVRWDLSADDAEVAALRRALDTCDDPPSGGSPGGGSPGGDTGITVSGLDCAGERVSVRNGGTVGMNLTGWTLHDAGTAHTFGFPGGFLLGPGTSVTVRSGGPASSGELAWTAGSVWNNDGDTAYLVDPAGATRSTRAC